MSLQAERQTEPSSESDVIDVVVVAGDSDPHAAAIEHNLAQLGTVFLRLDIQNVNRYQVVSRPGALLSLEGEMGGRVGRASTVWWRRPGSFDVSHMASDEALLAEAEAWTTFEGMIRASGARMVDPPWVIRAAEDKLFQLTLAQSLGIAIPDTLVTNSVEAARTFLDGGPAVAKSTSSGPGLAPYVDQVNDDIVALVATVPVLLQRALPAEADLRVVTVGDSVLVWRRERKHGDPWDWRAIDPVGQTFRSAGSVESQFPAGRLARSLGLTFSVQDWLEVDNAPVFLEVNPQGQWLFLQGATESIAPLLATHLIDG